MVGRTEARLCTTAKPPPYRASDRARALHDDAVGRRPPRRLAAVGPRPARARDARPGRRPAAASRATSRSRSSPPRRSRRATSTSSATTTAATMSSCSPSRSAGRRRRGGGSCRGRSTWRPGPTTLAARSDGRVPGHPLDGRPGRLRGRAARSIRAITAGLLAIEGAHALDGDPANVEVVADAGFRMMSPSHFFDNAFGGSAHGVEKGGLTDAGPRDGPADGGARDARRRRPCLGGHDRRRPRDGRADRSSPRTPGCAASPTTPAT